MHLGLAAAMHRPASAHTFHVDDRVPELGVEDISAIMRRVARHPPRLLLPGQSGRRVSVCVNQTQAINDGPVVGYCDAYVVVNAGWALVHIDHLHWAPVDEDEAAAVCRGLVRALTDDWPRSRVVRRIARNCEVAALLACGFELCAQSCDGVVLESVHGVRPVQCVDAFAVPGVDGSGASSCATAR